LYNYSSEKVTTLMWRWGSSIANPSATGSYCWLPAPLGWKLAYAGNTKTVENNRNWAELLLHDVYFIRSKDPQIHNKHGTCNESKTTLYYGGGGGYQGEEKSLVGGGGRRGGKGRVGKMHVLCLKYLLSEKIHRAVALESYPHFFLNSCNY
jgi:hypothetical protein